MLTPEPSRNLAEQTEIRAVSPLPEAAEITEPSTPPDKVAEPWWETVFQIFQSHGVTLILWSSGVGLAFPVAIQFLPPTDGASQISVHSQGVSLADYERLELGMSLTDAQATLGRAIEVSRDETTATYKWANRNGSAITVVFEGDRLVSKEQLGLK